MRTDVNCFIGAFPYRDHPGGSVDALRADGARAGIDRAWVSHVGAMFWRDPMAGNTELLAAIADDARCQPVFAVHPGLRGWESVLDRAVEIGAPAVRADPTFYGLDPTSREMRLLLGACGARGLPLIMAVRLEDGRQRHPNDVTATLEPSAIRALIRADPTARLVVTHADRECVEQVHWGSTPDEAARILWDISWIWGPPEDHLAHLVSSLGADRLCFGTGRPLRLAELSVAKLDLTPLAAAERAKIEFENAAHWATHRL